MGTDTYGTLDRQGELKKQLDRLGDSLRRLRYVLALFEKALNDRANPDAMDEKKMNTDSAGQTGRDKNLAALNHFLSFLNSDNDKIIN